MSKQQKKVKQNKKLLNATIAKKFGISFTAITYGLFAVVLLALLNMFMFARAAGIGLFSSFSRAVGVILFLASSFLIMVMLRAVAKKLSAALTAPIYELQDAMKKLKAGDINI